MKRRSSHKDRKDDVIEELNLTPFIDVFVTLIVFLLLSAVFVHLGSLAFKTPGSKSADNEVTQEPVREISLLVRVEDSQIKTIAYDSAKGSDVEEYRKTFPLKELKAFSDFLSALKQKEGSLTRTLFQVAPQTVYQRAIGVLEVLESSTISKDVVLAVGLEGDQP